MASNQQNKIPYKKKSIPQAIRVQVWNTYIGEQARSGDCMALCHKTIDVTDFECGHVIAEAKGGATTIENLRPICHSCNRSMSTMNLNEWISKHGLKPNQNNKIEAADDFVIIHVDKPKLLCTIKDCKNQQYKQEICQKHWKIRKCITKRCKLPKATGQQHCNIHMIVWPVIANNDKCCYILNWDNETATQCKELKTIGPFCAIHMKETLKCYMPAP